MKQVIFPIGVFETELIVRPPEEEYCREEPPWMAPICRQSFEVRKTSPCLMRYELEDGDKERLNTLRKQADDAALALVNHLMTRAECQLIADKYYAFADRYVEASNKVEKECKDFLYVELSDETDKGCHAEYRFNNGSIEGVWPCKIGEPYVIKLD